MKKQKRSVIKWSHYFIIWLAIGFCGCKGTNTNHGPTTSPAQSKAVFTEMLTPLEGTWKGRLITYSDPRGQVDEAPQPKEDFTSDSIIKRPTKTEQLNNIEFTYENDGEFSQRVKIVDRVKGQQKYTTHGIRKVEDGKITSIVNKFTGREIRSGYKDKDGNLVWMRTQEDPKITEFFKHIKTDKKIRIIGWGYYGQDDLTKAPRIWYLGDVKKVE